MDIEPQAAGFDAVLTIDTYDTNAYGNNFEGTSNTTGTATFVFTGTGTGITLYVDGYDIDTENEVAVYMNGEQLGFLEVTENNAQGLSVFSVDASMVEEGTNSITFVKAGEPTQIWGVTDLLIQDHRGPHDLPFAWDPEFHEDGYVVWQVNGDGFYIGEMDMDTGAFLGVINYLAVPPIPWMQTIQAVEIIETTDGGVAALGMSSEGLIYLSTTEGYVLEGTEGMRFAATPKGEVESLRFIVFDGTGQYLYDEGTLTRLPIPPGSQAFQWLDDDEVLIRNDFTDVTSVLNVETMETVVVTTTAYNSGQAAAHTASNGDQYLVFQGDGYNDIYLNTGSGWEFHQRMSNPFHVGDQFWSPEFFEWNGRLFILGFVADDLSENADAIVVMYDVGRDAWTRLSGVQPWKDPEVLILNDGSMAYYADNTSDGSQNYSKITYLRALLRAVPSEGTTLLIDRIAGDWTLSARGDDLISAADHFDFGDRA